MSFLISRSRTRRSKLRARQAPPEPGPRPDKSISCFTIVLFLWLAVMALLHGGQNVTYSSLAPGQRAPTTVIATVGFHCEDMGRTDLLRSEAAEAIPPVFTVNERPLHAATRSLDKLFDRILRIRAGREGRLTAAAFETAISDVIDLLGLALPPASVSGLAPQGEEEAVLAAIKAALAEVWARGIVSAEEVESSFQGTAAHEKILLRAGKEDPGKALAIDALFLPAEAVEATISLIHRKLRGLELKSGDLNELLAPWLTPNLIYDRSTTEQMRGQARRAVQPVAMPVREGTVLVERGSIATPQIVEQLRALELKLSSMQTTTEHHLRLLGNGSILIMALVICAGLLRIVRPAILAQRRSVLLLAMLSLLTLLPTWGLLYLATTTRLLPPGLVEFTTPLALAPLLGTILIGSAAAIVLGLWTSFAAAVMFGNSFPVFTMGLIATALAAYLARGVRTRARVFQAGLWIGAGELVYAMGLAALNQPEASIVLSQAGASLASGLLCAAVALLLIPLLEVLFGITTDIRLLEYSDPGHPLLQRLAKEAPGTYHHSLMVADLGRAAATEIGANELLLRVCAYFHDVGKLTKPEFFSENQQFCPNPHDALEPSMSTLIIVAHVKEGVALARQHKLPAPILDGIRQHHGTSLISYFYHRARKQHHLARTNRVAGDGNQPNESDYRYEGPKPQSREMGILLLADSVEAASRSLSKPTAGRIRSLVNDIVDARLQDHQLDESGLTLTELAAVRTSLVFSLTSMLHARIEYPQDEGRSTRSTDDTSGEPAETEEVHPMDYEQRTTA